MTWDCRGMAAVAGAFGERFWSKVNRTDTCWLWTGAPTAGGYGRIRYEGKEVYAHRLSYELFVGPIPDGLVIDHLCRVTQCVRPEHLEPVTHQENVRRGASCALIHTVRTHCKQGHEFDAANTIVNSRSVRRCLTCKRAHGRARYAKLRKAAKLKAGGTP